MHRDIQWCLLVTVNGVRRAGSNDRSLKFTIAKDVNAFIKILL